MPVRQISTNSRILFRYTDNLHQLCRRNIWIKDLDMNDLIEIGKESEIKNMIFTLRGAQVIMDRDLAKLYQVEVSQMNRQVKRNHERFPEDFMFQLTKEEYDGLKCQNGISNTRGGDRALPYAFTEQGVSMLAGLLRSDIAIKANIAIIRTFTALRKFAAYNYGYFSRLERIESRKRTSTRPRYFLRRADI